MSLPSVSQGRFERQGPGEMEEDVDGMRREGKVGVVVCLDLLVWWCHSCLLRNKASIISDFVVTRSHSAD